MKRSSYWIMACSALLLGTLAIWTWSLPRHSQCEVYRALVSDLRRPERGLGTFFMRPTSERGADAAIALWPALPFYTEQGETAHVFTMPLAISLLLGPPQQLRPCFQNEQAPSFDEASYDALVRTGQVASLWTVSNVAFVGRHALLYAEESCVGLCGGGGFYLWEWRDGRWTLVGYSEVWVS